MSSELNEFAKRLIAHVRDAAIRKCDRKLSTADSSAMAKRWRAARGESPEKLATVLIPDVVDKTLATLLVAIDQELLRLSFTSEGGTTIDLTQESVESGELSGWYAGGGGWCETYAKERWVDDLAERKDADHRFPDDEIP